MGVQDVGLRSSDGGGVLVLRPAVSTAVAIDDLSMIAGATDADGWADRVVYLPLR